MSKKDSDIKLKYQDMSLNFSTPEKYILSIRISPDGFSFSILDGLKSKFVGFHSFTFGTADSSIKLCKEIDFIYENNKWLQGDFRKVFVLIETPKSTLIPEPLFEASEKELYLKFNHTINSYEQIVVDFLKNVDAYNVFAIPDCLKYRIQKYYKRYKIVHYSTPLIESLLINNKNINLDKTVFLNMREKNMDIVILKDQRLRYFNSFHYQSKEDILYYLLFVLEQLGYNPEEVEVKLIGNIKKVSEEYDLLFQYIRNISFEERTGVFAYSYVFDKVASHFNYTLFNVNICEL